MSLSETIKINILINKKYQDKVLNFLQTYSLMQIELGDTADTDSPAAPPNELTTDNIDYDLAGVKFALDFLTPFDEIKVPLAEKLTGNKIKLGQGGLEKTVKDYNYKIIIEKCQNMESEISKCESELKEGGNEKEQLEPWRNLQIAPKQAETEKTKTIFGKINTQKYLDFINTLDKQTKETAITKVHLTDRDSFLALTFLKNHEGKVNKISNELGFDSQELPYADKLPKKALENIKIQEYKNTKIIGDLKNEARELTREMRSLKIIFDWLTWQKAKQEGGSKLARTNYTARITGWIEKAHFKILHNKLQKITKNNVEIKALDLKEKDKTNQPVVIKNKPFWRPFESVTGIYGLPKATETDPTVFLAPFFIIFFGFCLTDAGYGILLAALAYAAIKIMKVPRENQKLFRVLIYGGIVTFILGVVFGGWFGIALDDLPNSTIKNTLLALRQIDPIKNPLLVLGITFVMGVIQIWTGVIIAMWWEFKHKRYLDGILKHGVWVYFIPAILFWVANKAGVLPQSLMGLAKVLLWLGIAVMIATQGREQKSIIAKIGAGIISLYGLVGYLSDVLSYSRLLALGLATGIIAMVINLIAFLFKDMIPYVGWIVAIVILVGGHLFNLVINVLGAFIHSGRLQFVEFFPKFMEGGGARFRPLQRESKYVEIVDN
ncbi:V-type ATP synthase subunit I [Patescibacteria group bacterium]|nr:V-type ATP synthase subunit I [Patescibacteria group bacterium]MBU4512030.1 V-type ATP synthase subunit I [Patescibacteria group bacterium]MCG2693193.1 V-type ATP synthase subunit I [Candidatus Parcubacteria bacterium]